MRFRRDRVDVVDDDVSVRNPARYVAAAIGIAAIIFGRVRARRDRFRPRSPPASAREHATVHHTPLLALMEIGFGVTMLVAAFGTFFGRMLMAAASVAALGFGLVIVADLWPERLHNWFGVHDRNGWLYVVVGGAGLLAAVVLPVTKRRRVVERETRPEVADDRDRVAR